MSLDPLISAADCMDTKQRDLPSRPELFTEYSYHSTLKINRLVLGPSLTGCIFCWDLETVLELN